MPPPGVPRSIRVVLTVMLVLVLCSCRGGSGTPVVGQTPEPKAIQLSLQQVEPAAGKLVLSVIAQSGQPIFQLSTRIMFDQLAVKPVAIERGGLVGEHAVFFALDGQPGFVPLAFTYHQGDQLPGSAGTVALIEFEVLDASLPANIRFTADSEYIIARDAGGNSLPITLAVAQ